MQKVIIIGGGASGIMTAIHATSKNNEVVVLERNSSCCKKLLMTGNGRCNYWNEDQQVNHYHSNKQEELEKIITPKNQKDVLSFFDQIGIIPKIKEGYYYPFSNQAVSVEYALLLQAKLNGIKIITDCFVSDIEYKNNFIVKTNKGKMLADKVVIATGSKAIPKTGSDGNGYFLAEKLGLLVTPVLPSLVQLKGEEKYFKNWNGIRTEVDISIYENDNFIKKELGEIQLTNYGISGICVFNLSRYVSKYLSLKHKVSVKINFLPWLKNEEEVLNFLLKRNKIVKNRTISQLLEGVLNYKLVSVLLKETKINNNLNLNELTQIQKEKLINNLYSFKSKIIDTKSFDSAQVCSGGVSLDEINIKTFETKKIKGLYLTGEILDVDGDCGGYNLGFAWISGMLAGRSIKGENND